MVPAKVLRVKEWLTGREAKSLLESEIYDELDSVGELNDEQFFSLIEEQKSWMPVYVRASEPRIRALSKHMELVGMAAVTGDFLLEDENMFDEKRMYGPPDVVVELGRSNVYLLCEGRDGGKFTNAFVDGHFIAAKVFFRMTDILRLADMISYTEQSEEKVEACQPVQRQQAQQTAILEALKAAGHDPLKLPKFRPGKPWVKGEIWNKLKAETQLFSSKKVFDTGWQNLRDYSEIRES